MDCIFCKIVKGEIPSFKFWEDETHMAFLDIRPIKEGHTMVIPKKHDPYIFEMADEDLQKLILAAKQAAKILKDVFNPKLGKIGVLVVGNEVPHTHIHLVPIDKAGEVNLAKAKFVPHDELKKTLQKIKSLTG
jgi:histidine triad (HIT) family protein